MENKQSSTPMILGIVSMCLLVLAFFFATIIVTPVSLAISGTGVYLSKRDEGKANSLCMASLIVGIVFMIMAVIMLAVRQ